MTLTYSKNIINTQSDTEMGFYDLVSMALTIVGTFVLIYRTVHEIDAASKASKLEKMCTKWVIFVIFLKIEYWILAVLEIIPLGALAMLVIKFLLFMPENPISHKIYKTIQKKLERVKMDEYHSYVGVYLSKTCKFAVVGLMKLVGKIAEYVNSNDIQEVEIMIMEVVKLLEYKKAAVNMRVATTKSQINQELNDSEFNTSASEDEIMADLHPKKVNRKTHIGQQFSKLLAELDEEDNQETLKVNAELMIVKPNKSLDQKAKYEEVLIEFYLKTRKITFTNKNKAVESGTLREVKWITKNMINIQLILEGRSKVIKLLQKQDVAKFVEPLCEIIEKAGK